ncbi:MAG: hypothetical protein P4L66_05240 [Acetobacteraceae bacterium]|nr:hypothetical protein [Acetobacteraceae bacterium]
MIQPDIRRIIAVEAHRLRSGTCPPMIHALGTGETFHITPTPDGFIDQHTGMRIRVTDGAILLPEPAAPISIILEDDVGFAGFDPGAGAHFSGRAGGGSSVTLYDSRHENFFQYAVVDEHGL